MMGFVGDASGMETYYESVWRREWEMTSAGAEKQMIMMPSGEAKWCCVSLREKNLARLAPNATPTALVGSGERRGAMRGAQIVRDGLCRLLEPGCIRIG